MNKMQTELQIHSTHKQHTYTLYIHILNNCVGLKGRVLYNSVYSPIDSSKGLHFTFVVAYLFNITSTELLCEVFVQAEFNA